jgi:alkanesulfonate monooxygenase SsuD/methylene tetrahydromethanopterin reductase-like flavin-dependent oxidoreductase (luciferase family)
MLALTGREADGTITWMTGPKTIRDHTAPRICEAAAAAGRPTPRVVVGLPIAVTAQPEAARASASRTFQVYGMLPSYRAMLDREGVQGPADVAIVGGESDVRAAIDEVRAAGATDLLAIPFGVEGDRASVARTRALLSDLARAA